MTGSGYWFVKLLFTETEYFEQQSTMTETHLSIKGGGIEEGKKEAGRAGLLFIKKTGENTLF